MVPCCNNFTGISYCQFTQQWWGWQFQKITLWSRVSIVCIFWPPKQCCLNERLKHKSSLPFYTKMFFMSWKRRVQSKQRCQTYGGREQGREPALCPWLTFVLSWRLLYPTLNLVKGIRWWLTPASSQNLCETLRKCPPGLSLQYPFSMLVPFLCFLPLPLQTLRTVPWSEQTGLHALL